MTWYFIGFPLPLTPSVLTRQKCVGGTYVEFIALDLFQFQGNRVFPWLIPIYVTYSMRRQVDLAILMIGKLVFPRTRANMLALVRHETARRLVVG